MKYLAFFGGVGRRLGPVMEQSERFQDNAELPIEADFTRDLSASDVKPDRKWL